MPKKKLRKGRGVPPIPEKELCVTCKKARAVTKKSRKCHNCWIKPVVDNASQLHKKKGPRYDRWREGMRSYAQKLEDDV